MFYILASIKKLESLPLVVTKMIAKNWLTLKLIFVVYADDKSFVYNTFIY